ncbi:MAG: hypothetical protein HQ519_05415 [Planctomycetes bacterium]|nr:hypothetical protein [Planctomycetota bacterium]
MALPLWQCAAPPHEMHAATYRGASAEYWIGRVQDELPEGNLSGLEGIVMLAPFDPKADELLWQILHDQCPRQILNVAMEMRDLAPSLHAKYAPRLIELFRTHHSAAGSYALEALVLWDLQTADRIPGFHAALAKAQNLRDGSDYAPDLNSEAWGIVDPEFPQRPHQYSLALDLAQASVRLDGRRNTAYLDTLAWTYFRLGRVAEAIATEQEAIRKTDPEGSDWEEFQAVLQLFQEANS